MSRGRKRVAFIGGTEVGKSTQIKKMIDVPRVSNEGIIIYDENYQKAWQNVTEINMQQWEGMKKGRYKISDPDYKKFYSIASEKYKRGWAGTIIHEDAGNALGPQKDDALFRNLIGLRHKATDLIFVFHSLADTPAYVMRQLNEIILFKTGDSWSKVADRPPDDKVEEVKAAFEFVNQSPNRFAWKRVILRPTGTMIAA